MENSDYSTVARGRLAVLSAHLSAATDCSGAISSGILEYSGCSAAVPPPPNSKGLMTLIDERTGKKYQVQISEEGTIKATDLKKVNFISIVNFMCFGLIFLLMGAILHRICGYL